MSEPARSHPLEESTDGENGNRHRAASPLHASGEPPHGAPEHGARGLYRVLEERMRDTPEPSIKPPETPAEEPKPQEPSSGAAVMSWRTTKALIGVALIAIFGWVPLTTLLQPSSVQAVVNSRLVTLRAPIDGQVIAESSVLSNPKTLEKGKAILRIINPRAERAHLDDLRRDLARLENEQPAIAAKLASARTAESDLKRQASRFAEGRKQQLEARIAELKSLIEVAAAKKEEAIAAVERATALSRSGSVSSVEMARLMRERSIAERNEVAARSRLDAAQVELAAAKDGIFIGDSYNDRPSSVQRAEEMRERVNTLTADLASAESQIAWLRGEAAAEDARHTTVYESTIALPVSGRIWEVMTAPGEQVRAGQPLLKILDCTGAIVTANVTESVYNTLRVGAPARFRPADGSPDLDGVVMNLTGVAGAAANLAIDPGALSKEPYRVTVAVPKLSSAEDCTVGRTGRVMFRGENAETL